MRSAHREVAKHAVDQLRVSARRHAINRIQRLQSTHTEPLGAASRWAEWARTVMTCMAFADETHSWKGAR